MKMTQEAERRWLHDPATPESVLQEALEQHAVRDWPLPPYLLEDLQALSQRKDPSQSEVDDARIPLMNWFRQQREAAATQAAGVIAVDDLSQDVLGQL